MENKQFLCPRDVQALFQRPDFDAPKAAGVILNQDRSIVSNRGTRKKKEQERKTNPGP